MTCEVGIPHADRVPHTDLAHEEAVHPPETELDELDAFSFHVLRQRTIYPRRQIAESSYLALDTWLRVNVVILDSFQQFRKTPETVCFYGIKNGSWKHAGIYAGLDVWICNVLAKEDLPEGCDKVIDALYVA